MNRLPIYFLLFLFIDCSNTVRQEDIIGKYKSHGKWSNNETFITLQPDSGFAFEVVKEYFAGKKYFCSVGKWTILKDSFLRIESDTIKRNFKTYFPEISDTQHVITLNMTGNFIYRDKKIYVISTDGKASVEQFYDKIEANK